MQRKKLGIDVLRLTRLPAADSPDGDVWSTRYNLAQSVLWQFTFFSISHLPDHRAQMLMCCLDNMESSYVKRIRRADERRPK